MPIPGVIVSTSVRSGPIVDAIPPSGTAFFVGSAERGSTVRPGLVYSMDEFDDLYGNWTSSTTLWDHVKCYFEEGGGRAFIQRAIGASAVKATLTLLNTEGAPLTTIRLDAKSAGTWGNTQVSVTVSGSPTTTIIRITGPDAVVRTYGAPSGTVAGTAYVQALVDAINHPVTGNPFVDAVYTLAGAAPGTSTFHPANVGPVSLATGANGTAPTDAENLAALNLFTKDLGPGVVAIPNASTAATHTNLAAHAVANDRIAFIGFGVADTAAQAITAKEAAVTAIPTGEEYVAAYHPHVKVPTGSGATRNISPESFAAAARAKAHQVEGPQRGPAGAISANRYVTEPVILFSTTDLNLMHDAQVNPIRTLSGSTRVYGVRSISADTVNWTFITYRDLCNVISHEAAQRLEEFLFSTVDNRHLFMGKVEGALVGMLEPYRQGTALYPRLDATGNIIDPGYVVNVSPSLNPPQQLAAGIVKATIGVRVSPIAERIELQITKSTLTGAL